MKTKVTICIGLLLVAGVVVGARRADPAGRMKSETIRFSQTWFYNTGEITPPQSPAEQFDDWRHSEKRDILAISFGEERLFPISGSYTYIDVLYQIPESECYGGPVQEEPLITD